MSLSSEEKSDLENACRELYELQAQIYQLSEEFEVKIPKAVLCELSTMKYEVKSELVKIGIDETLMKRLLEIIRRINELLDNYGSTLKKYRMDSISVNLWLITFNFKLPDQ